MKQEQFKNVYQQIHLSDTQKDRIWQHIEAVSNPQPIRKRTFLPARAAACLGTLLLSGMTVFAANELSLTDKITEAIHLLTQNKDNSTEAQKNLYAQYGQVLDNEIELDNGTLKLDAALYDENHLLVPFRYLYHSDVAGYEELTAGADLDQTSLRKTKNLYCQDTNTFLSDIQFRILQDSDPCANSMGQYLITNPVIAEDGMISGTLLLFTYESKSFAPGTVIQFVKTADSENNTQTAEEMTEQTVYALCTEFTLGKALEQYELTIDSVTASSFQDMGISVERMSISPLSLCYFGTGTHTRGLSAAITVVLKDGSIVEMSPTGGGYSLRDANQDNTSFTFFASKVFATPVLIEEIAEVHIQDYRGADIHISLP